MADEMSSQQFQILREDFASMRTEFNARLDNLVTRESFRDEQRRVDGMIQSQGREIGELKTSLTSEVSARLAAEQKASDATIHEAREREKIRRQTSWQWLSIALAPVIAIIAGYVFAHLGITGG
jgi:hypothetical protein